MTERMRGLFADAGLERRSTLPRSWRRSRLATTCPPDWVVLQERHVALGFQELLFERLATDERTAFLERLYGGPPAAAADDAVATQGELRARLMKAGGPAFVGETPIPFDEGLGPRAGPRRHPLLPDPCRRRLTHLRVRSTLVRARRPGPGSRHPRRRAHPRAQHAGRRGRVRDDVPRRRPLRARGHGAQHAGAHPARADVPGRRAALAARPRICWEGTCVVAAHQHLRQQGQPGYVDARAA